MVSEPLSRRALLASLLFWAASGCALIAQSGSPGPRVLTRIPPRPVDAPTGSEFAAATAGMSGLERQQRAVDELLAGNVPPFLRTLVPVALAADSRKRRSAATAHSEPAAWVWVLPDYLAIGSDGDFLRIPLTLPRALEIASAWDMFVPTRKIVDAVFVQAEVKLAPRPLTPGPRMRSSEYYLRHQQLIEAARTGRPLGALTAGHKKDVVLTKRLLREADRIAIYGWHRVAGEVIQPLSTVHGERYADYSHGLRLVDAVALHGTEERRLDTLLVDPATARVFNYEGALPRQLVPKR